MTTYTPGMRWLHNFPRDWWVGSGERSATSGTLLTLVFDDGLHQCSRQGTLSSICVAHKSVWRQQLNYDVTAHTDSSVLQSDWTATIGYGSLMPNVT